MAYRFNPAPGWPVPPQGWVPPEGWVPDPSWPPAPAGWNFWLEVPDAAAPVSPAAAPQPTTPMPAVTSPPPPAATSPASANPAMTTPMPAVAPAPPTGGGMPPQPAPASVPYAQYNHVPAAGSASQPGLVQERRRSPLVWLVPLVLLLVGGVAWGVIALLNGPDDKPTDSAAPTVTATATPTPDPATTPPPAENPAPEAPPTEAAPTEAPPAGGDDQAATTAFCPAALSLYTAFGQATSTETVAEFIAIYEPAVAAMPQAAPPAQIAEAWAFKHTNDTEMIAAIKAGDQSLKPIDAYMSFQIQAALKGDEFVTQETALTEFVSDRCY